MPMRPMSAVLDTNVVISGLLWHGAPRDLLDRGTTGDALMLITSPTLILELLNVIALPRFSKRVAATGKSVAELVEGYRDATMLIQPRTIPRVVTDDLDDDHVIAAAVASRAACVVTGDQAHLLPIGIHKGIAIVSPRQCLAMLDR